MAEKTRCEECDRNFPSLDALSMHNTAKHSSTIVEKKRLSKKSIMTLVIIAIILISGFWFVYNSSGRNTTGNVVNENTLKDNKDSSNPSTNNEIQKITLSMKNNYYPNTITVKSGVPVEITLDSSVGGCYRSFSIPKLGVSKRSSNPSDTIKFTPSQKGTFRYQCSMGMGTGTIIVE
ncbi:MAG: cupredoxin domain-containing protein [Nanoarchaeota archaeon]